MNSAAALDLALTATIVGAELAAPVLITSLMVGFVISLFQLITQIQEVAPIFVSKTIAVGVALYIYGYWVLQMMVNTTLDVMVRASHLLNS